MVGVFSCSARAIFVILDVYKWEVVDMLTLVCPIAAG